MHLPMMGSPGDSPSHGIMPHEDIRTIDALKSVHSLSSLTTTASNKSSPRTEIGELNCDLRPPPLGLSESLGCSPAWMVDQRTPTSYNPSRSTPKGSARRNRKSSKTRPDSGRSASLVDAHRLKDQFYLPDREDSSWADPCSPLSPCSPFSTMSLPLSPLPSPSQLWIKRKGSKTSSRLKLAPLVQTNLPAGCSPRPQQQSQMPPRGGIRPLKEHEKIFDRYYWEEVLQEDGDGGKVVVCSPKQDKGDTPRVFNYVMKIRSKATLRKQQPGFEDSFRTAQEHLLTLPPHAGVMPLKEVLEDDRFYYIVMDRANGGSFFTGLLDEFKDGVVPVGAIQKVMREILEALCHVHDQGLLHRDIKPDNLVMQVCADGSKRVMLIDFDHANSETFRQPKGERYTEDVFGTLRFNAPETFAGAYSQQSDLWSVGVILYLLMTGKMPYSDDIFDEETESGVCPATPKFSWKKAIAHRLRSEQIDWRCDNAWESQPLCQDLCMKLLTFKPKDRTQSAREALSHAWFASGSTATL